jgi:hypothetical protein
MPKEALYACQLSGVSPSLANSVSFFSVCMGPHKQWFRKVVTSDDGYEIAFTEKVNRVQTVF